MNRLEFSKVIGKGGQTISNIRTTCGAQVKGTDIDAENRLVIVTGTLRQVLEAFEMITDLMHAAYCQSVPSEHFSVQMLLEHSKVRQLHHDAHSIMSESTVIWQLHLTLDSLLLNLCNCFSSYRPVVSLGRRVLWYRVWKWRVVPCRYACRRTPR